MAVAAAAPVRIRYFVRLKLRLVRNGLRGQARRIVGYVFGLLFGFLAALAGFLLFFLSGALKRADAGLVMVAFGGAALVVGWLLLPLLFFGVDETLDPARFALLPLPRRTLAVGMLAAACVGIPGLATALALIGVVAGAALRGGPAGALVALVGAALSLLLCVVVSRAVTSGFAALLRSRRARDLTALLLALIAASIGPLQLFANSLAVHTSLAPVVRVARVLGWTPLAAGFVAPYDLVDGRPLLAVARLAIVAASVLALLWWWSRTLESAMLGTSSGGATGGGPAPGGVVRALVPRLLRTARPGIFLGIVARELRYWSRDPRRRAGLISAVVGGAALPITIRVAAQAGARHGAGLPMPLAVAFPALIGAVLLGNQFGYDGTAYSMHLLAAVRGRTELRARAVALAMVLFPILVVLAVVLVVLTHDEAGLVPALGTIVGMLGTVMGLESVLSIFAAYPMPEGRNAFSVNSGSGSLKALVALGGMVAAAALAAPVLILALVLHGGFAVLLAPIGVAYGVAALLVGTYIGGDILDRRGAELLVAVTPRR